MVNLKFGPSSDVIDSSLQELIKDYSDNEMQNQIVQITVDYDPDVVDLNIGDYGQVLAVCNSFWNLQSTLSQVVVLSKMPGVKNISLYEHIGERVVRDEEGLEEEIGGEPTEIELDLDTTNWYDQLTKDEIVQGSDGQPCPKLAGLRRLAKPFIKEEYSVVNKVTVVKKEVARKLQTWEKGENGKLVVVGIQEVVGHDYYPYASVSFTVHLNDGRSFTDSADAYFGNCNDLGNYPTAVASARAEGRVLRKVLGIKEHVYEELSSKDAIEELSSTEDLPISSEQKKLIEMSVAKMDNVNLKSIIDKVTVRDVLTLDELTGAEAKSVLKVLGELKKQEKKNKKS